MTVSGPLDIVPTDLSQALQPKDQPFAMIDPIFKSVRDPVHQFIVLTPIEQVLVDRPEFQRLRHVLQQSAAYSTFPSNSTNRFSHSLGAMHLSGSCFQRALQNASVDDRSHFMRSSQKLITFARQKIIGGRARDKLVEEWRQHLGTACGFNYAAGEGDVMSLDRFEREWVDFLSGGAQSKFKLGSNDKFRFVINVLWQSVRMATLVHDIGHLPLSHVFEHALDRARAGDPDGLVSTSLDTLDTKYESSVASIEPGSGSERGLPVHEKLGTIISKEFPHEGAHQVAETDLYQLCLWLSIQILSVSSPHDAPNLDAKGGTDRYSDELSVLRFLHTIVSGEIDADRLDYCMRDPHSAGTEHGAIDTHRIISEMTLWRDPSEDVFCLAAGARSLQAVEMFFAQRFAAYRAIVDQHNVARFNAIAEEIIVRLCLLVVSGAPEPILDLLTQYRFIDKSESNTYELPFLAVDIDRNEHFRRYDDCWMRSMFSDLLALTQYPAIQASREHDAKERLEELFLDVLLDTYLYRKIQNTLSLWKHEIDYYAFAQSVEETSDGAVSRDRAMYWLSGAGGVHLLLNERVKEAHQALFQRPLLEFLGDKCEGRAELLFRIRRIRVLDTTDSKVMKLPILSTGPSLSDARFAREAVHCSPFLRRLAEARQELPVWQVFGLAEGLRARSDNGDSPLILPFARAAVSAFTRFVQKADTIVGVDPDE